MRACSSLHTSATILFFRELQKEGTRGNAARKLYFPSGENIKEQPRFYRLRKNSCFVSGHDFSRAVNDGSDQGFSPWDFEGYGLQAVRKRLSPVAEKHIDRKS